MKIIFDVDGCLIHQVGEKTDTPKYDVIQLFHLFESFGWEMYIWSGGGIDYAKRWAEKLGLNAKIISKGEIKPDIAVDDEEVTLGVVNIQVTNFDV